MAMTKEQFDEKYTLAETPFSAVFHGPELKSEESARIARETKEFLKCGGKIHEVKNSHATGGGLRTKLSDQEQRALDQINKQLRIEHGNCNVRWEAATNKFRAFFRGCEVGEGFDEMKKAAKAIKNAALPVKE